MYNLLSALIINALNIIFQDSKRLVINIDIENDLNTVNI